MAQPLAAHMTGLVLHGTPETSKAMESAMDELSVADDVAVQTCTAATYEFIAASFTKQAQRNAVTERKSLLKAAACTSTTSQPAFGQQSCGWCQRPIGSHSVTWMAHDIAYCSQVHQPVTALLIFSLLIPHACALRADVPQQRYDGRALGGHRPGRSAG